MFYILFFRFSLRKEGVEEKGKLNTILRVKKEMHNAMMQKTTDEIRALLRDAKLDFQAVENKALNNYLPKIFHICPFTEDICTKERCIKCTVFLENAGNRV